MLFTVLGTLLHEGGHYLGARLLGLKSSINYRSSSCDWLANPSYEKVYDFHFKNLKNKLPVPDEIKEAQAELNFAIKLVTWGGPIQTMLTGTFGLLLLFWYKRGDSDFSWKHWCLVFLSLFWLRPAMNLVMSLPKLFIKGTFAEASDEVRLARLHEFHPLFFSVLFGVIGLLVLSYISFFVIPRKSLLVFWASGLIGGICGFYLWFFQVGPILMP